MLLKVALAAKDHVPDFGPPLPDPAIFQKVTVCCVVTVKFGLFYVTELSLC